MGHALLLFVWYGTVRASSLKFFYQKQQQQCIIRYAHSTDTFRTCVYAKCVRKGKHDITTPPPPLLLARPSVRPYSSFSFAAAHDTSTPTCMIEPYSMPAATSYTPPHRSQAARRQSHKLYTRRRRRLPPLFYSAALADGYHSVGIHYGKLINTTYSSSQYHESKVVRGSHASLLTRLVGVP